MKKFFTSLICVLAVFVSLCFAFPVNAVAKAEDSGSLEQPAEVSYDLISPNFFTTQSEVLDKYNIVGYDYQSPFNEETGEKLGGYSFMFEKEDEDNQILGSQYVNVDEVTLETQTDYCFTIWINFNSVYVHDLSLSLVLENGASLSWSFTQTQLINMLAKYSDLTNYTNGVPYAWNKFILPFSVATVQGELTNGTSYYKIEKLVVNFEKSAEGITVPEGSYYSVLRFYNPSILQKEQTELSIQKQDYFFADFNQYSEDYINSLIKGDTINLPNLNSAVKYAWAGFEDVKNSTRSTIVWMITITDPSSQKTSISFASGTTPYTFEQSGTYVISYQCVDTNLSSTKAIISSSQKIIVKDMNAIRLDLPNKKLEVGKTYKIKAYTSSLFQSTQNLTITSSSENVVVTTDNDGYVYITVNKEGDYTLNASVEGTRVASPTFKEYTASFTIKSYQEKVDTNKIIFIIGAVLLGVILVVGVALLIKAIIKDRKTSVR